MPVYEAVICEHMPKTATARNKATKWNKRTMLGKKINFLDQETVLWVGRATGNRNFLLVQPKEH